MTHDKIFNPAALRRKFSRAIDSVSKKFLNYQAKSASLAALAGLTNTQKMIATGGLYNSTDPYFKLWIVYLCVHNMSDIVGSYPYGFEDKKGDPVDIESNPASKLVLSSPNEIETSPELFVRWAADLILTGDCYSYVLGPDEPWRRPVSIIPLIAGQVCPYAPREIIESYHYSGWSEYKTPFPPATILHTREFNEHSRVTGQSWIQAGLGKINLAGGYEEYQQSVGRNGAFPMLNFKTDQELQPEQRVAYEKLIAENYQGLSKAGGWFLSDKGVAVSPLAMSPADLQIVESDRMTAAFIASMLNYPPELLGVLLPTVNVNSYQQALKQLHRQGAIPLARKILARLNKYFFPAGDFRFVLHENQISALQPTAEELATQYHTTPNEKRVAMGMVKSDDPNMDKIYVPSGWVALDDIGFDGDGENL